MIDTHLRLKDNIHKSIRENSKKKNTSFNDECNRLLEISLIADTLLFRIEELIKEVKQLNKNGYVTKRLLEQLYSDIGLNITEVNKSKNLQEFYKRLRKGKYYD